MTRRRIPQLDGVRGIAILLVILHNESTVFPSLHLERVFASGWMGVDLFFVLSGFLITGILVDSRGSDRYFANFYARRCLRIWPLYYTLLLFMFVIVPRLRPSEAHTVFDRSSPAWSYPLFLQNFFVAVPTSAAGPLAVTWSLAIEEQFYLVWPWIVRWCSGKQLAWLAGLVIAASPLVRVVLAAHGVELYTNVFCRLDGLMAGALLAVVVRSPGVRPAAFVRRAGLVLVLALPLSLVTDAIGAQWAAFSLSAAWSAAFVYLALFSPWRLFQRGLTNRFLVGTGIVSYGLYLLHKIPFDAAKSFGLGRHPLVALPLLLVACYALASLSWVLLETPVLKYKRRLDNPADERDRQRVSTANAASPQLASAGRARTA